MKNFKKLIATTVLVAASALLLAAVPNNQMQGQNAMQPQGASMQPQGPTKVRYVNFKKCVEQSQMGKQEQASFEALKKQMETVLAEKEKVLNELATKLEDVDFLDSLSAEKETELKRQFRTLGQEYTQLQQQYLQTLNQTNFKVVQKINEKVGEAATTVAKQNNYDLVVNDETLFFANPSLDISQQVIAIMDQTTDKESSETPKKPELPK